MIRVKRPRRMRWVGHVARNGRRILLEKPEERVPLWRSRCRWQDRIQVDLKERGWEGVVRSNSVQDRENWRAVVKMTMNFPIPYNAGNICTSCRTISFSAWLCCIEVVTSRHSFSCRGYRMSIDNSSSWRLKSSGIWRRVFFVHSSILLSRVFVMYNSN